MHGEKETGVSREHAKTALKIGTIAKPRPIVIAE